MPTYVYRCPEGHTTEVHVPLSEWRRVLACSECQLEARQVIEGVAMHMPLLGEHGQWVKRGPDTANEIWEGTALEGTDGVNQEHYQAKSLHFDLGDTSDK